jgi:hypothetical protein
MTEVVGFQFGATLRASLLALMLLSPLLFGYPLFLALRKKRIRWFRISAWALATWLVATTASEMRIVADENSFAQEVPQADVSGKDIYSRDRAWPNGSCSLVWNRGHGIHATD